MNVTLIGMAGAGKSYFGKRLARRLRMEFLDIDSVLEEIYGKELEKILEELGDEQFVKVEAGAIMSATKGKDAHVFSPGGSSIYEPDAMEHLKKISSVVFLDVPFSTIESRIGRASARMGRIVGLGTKTFRELYDERRPLYTKYADFVVETEAHDADTIVRMIADFVANR